MGSSGAGSERRKSFADVQAWHLANGVGTGNSRPHATESYVTTISVRSCPSHRCSLRGSGMTDGDAEAEPNLAGRVTRRRNDIELGRPVPEVQRRHLIAAQGVRWSIGRMLKTAERRITAPAP